MDPAEALAVYLREELFDGDRDRHLAWIRVAYVKDPDGNWIELYQNPRPIEEFQRGTDCRANRLGLGRVSTS